VKTCKLRWKWMNEWIDREKWDEITCLMSVLIDLNLDYCELKANILLLELWWWIFQFDFVMIFFGTWMNSMRIPLISARLTSSCCQCEASCFQTSTISAANCICKSCSELFTAKWVHYLNFWWVSKTFNFLPHLQSELNKP